jgi:hypothetical protein
MVVLDREGGSFDRGNSSLLMFHKKDLPSGKKGGKANMLFVWIDQESDCDKPPRKIPYYRLDQSTLVIKQ